MFEALQLIFRASEVLKRKSEIETSWTEKEQFSGI
jgi:hypothetical protein